MDKKEKRVTRLPFEGKDGETLLEVSVAYAAGGYNYRSGQNEAGGFYVHVTPIKLERGWPVYTMGAGYKVCVERAQRFNAKKLEQWALSCMEAESVKNCIERVRSEYGKTA